VSTITVTYSTIALDRHSLDGVTSHLRQNDLSECSLVIVVLLALLAGLDLKDWGVRAALRAVSFPVGWARQTHRKDT